MLGLGTIPYLPCLHFSRSISPPYELPQPRLTVPRSVVLALAHTFVVSCCNEYRVLYWVELPSHDQWTLMNPQIVRRVEDPYRTQ